MEYFHIHSNSHLIIIIIIGKQDLNVKRVLSRSFPSECWIQPPHLAVSIRILRVGDDQTSLFCHVLIRKIIFSSPCYSENMRSHLWNIQEKANLEIRKQTHGYLGWRKGTGSKGSLQGDGNVLKLDCGDGWKARGRWAPRVKQLEIHSLLMETQDKNSPGQLRGGGWALLGPHISRSQWLPWPYMHRKAPWRPEEKFCQGLLFPDAF